MAFFAEVDAVLGTREASTPQVLVETGRVEDMEDIPETPSI